MLSRRKLKRRRLIYYLRVFDSATNQPVGRVVDISAQGIMLISEHPIPTDTIASLHMEVPAEGGQIHHIAFRARSVYCRRDSNPDFYVTGFQLLDPPESTVAQLNALIEELGFGASEHHA